MHLTSFVYALFFVIQPAFGWGELGHRTVAYLGEKYLTPEGANLVKTLLANNQGYDISDAAIWADAIKRRPGYEHTGIWHYLDAKDTPPSSCGIKYPEDCHDKGRDGCIISALVNETLNVNDKSLSLDAQKEALMFVIHFLGDIHQPLHIEGAYRGGNDIHICFFNRCANTNLHEAWDTLIINKFRDLHSRPTKPEIKAAAAKFAQELFISNYTEALQKECTDIKTAEKCSLSWAVGTNKLLCQYVMHDGIDWQNKPRLAEEYYEGAVPIIKDQITIAGLRLGAWINAIAAAHSFSTEVMQDTEYLQVQEL